jgi:GxxExxY protein
MNADGTNPGPDKTLDDQRSEINQITERIIGCVHRVSNTLGSGFLEKVYENALAIELRKNGLNVAQQHGIKGFYDNTQVGDFAADLLVENRVIVELKAAKTLDEVHSAQCLNYLKATGLKVCLLVNFGRPRVDVKRIVLDY